jgi:hypothetical protein
MKRALALLLLISDGCVEAPFERTNPYDPKAALTMRLAGGVDTATVAGQTILYQLVTDPALSGYEPEWDTDTPSRVRSEGYGRFVVITLSIVTPTTVMVRAKFGSRVVQRPLVIKAQ